MRKNVAKPTLLEEMQKKILWLTGLRQMKRHLQSAAVLNFLRNCSKKVKKMIKTLQLCTDYISRFAIQQEKNKNTGNLLTGCKLKDLSIS